jgi:hypothetical protein
MILRKLLALLPFLTLVVTAACSAESGDDEPSGTTEEALGRPCPRGIDSECPAPYRCLATRNGNFCSGGGGGGGGGGSSSGGGRPTCIRQSRTFTAAGIGESGSSLSAYSQAEQQAFQWCSSARWIGCVSTGHLGCEVSEGHYYQCSIVATRCKP